MVAVADVDHPLSWCRRADRETWHPVDDVHDQPVPVEVCAYDHVERGRGGALLLVAAHMQVRVVGAAVGEPVDQPRIAVVGADDGLVGGEQRVVLAVGHAVRVLLRAQQPGDVDDVDHPNREFGQVPAEQGCRGSTSRVGTSPAQASTTSGSPGSDSVPAQARIPACEKPLLSWRHTCGRRFYAEDRGCDSPAADELSGGEGRDSRAADVREWRNCDVVDSERQLARR